MEEVSLRVREDRDARRLAQTVFDRPLLLEAGAGTGKTAVLVARIVAWVLGPGWERARASNASTGDREPQKVASEVVRRVVAITFTEAAAAEMATRVAEALLEIRLGEALPPGLEGDALPADPAVRRERAEALVGVLDQLPVRTIHAWCRRLLVEHPFEAGVHPGFEVDADGHRAAEIARDVLEAHLPRAFADPPDPDFATLLLAGIGPGDLETALAGLLSEGACAADLEDDPLAPERIAVLTEPLEAALAAMVRIDAGRVAELARRSRHVAALAEALATLDAAAKRRPLRDRAALEAWLAQLHDLLDDGPLGKLRDAAKGTPGATVEKALGDDLEAWCEAARRLRPLLEHARSLEPAQLDAARRVLGRLLAEAGQRMRAQGVEGFGGLLRGARDVLAARPDVAAAVRGTIDQLLVDEFQDTDALQCEILDVLALQGPPERRPALFLVGDPKQSIYGWRRADLAAYDGFRGRLEAAGGTVAPLVVNHRSVPAILEEVERLVRPVMHAAPGLQPPFERLEPCERLAGEEGYRRGGCAPVEHWLPLVRSDDGSLEEPTSRAASEIEARAVARDLRRLRDEGVALGRVGLLLRATSDFEIYLGALRDAGIRFVVERETRHYERREVVDAMALVRCVLDPHDHLALVATLRSPTVGVPDAALVPLWTRGFPARVAELDGREPSRWDGLAALVEDAARATSGEGPGAAEAGAFAASLRSFLAALDGLRRLHGEASAEDFVEALRSWTLTEATEAARYLGSYRAANLDRFFRELTDALEASGGSASAVVARLRRAGSLDREHEEGRPRVLGDDAVQVMTIHRAKGLAFDHVYLLQTHKGSGGGRERRTQVVQRGPFRELVLLDAPSPGLLFADRARAEVDACERVRLLYVAATRARERLVVSGLRRLDGPVDPDRFQSHGDLLTWREEAPAPLAAFAADLASRPGASVVDANGVRWRLPALDDAEAVSEEERRPAGVAPAPVARDARELAACREIAGLRAERTVSRTASEEEAWSEARAARVVGEEREAATPDDRERRIALAAGTAVHEALEVLDASAPDPEQGGRALATALAGLAEEERSAATARAVAILDRFLAGPLAARLRAIAPHVVARELPVLLPPGDGPDEPVGFWSGAIDLLYCDPATGAWVIADYKTDAVEGEALRARAAAYAGQGRVYARAVQEALGLPETPRFELWFLQAGEVVEA